MKLLAEFLQMKLGERKTELFFTTKEYMEYADITHKAEVLVTEELLEYFEQLLNARTRIGSFYESIVFSRINIVKEIAISPLVYLIKFSDYTLTLRQKNKNWLVDCVGKGDK